EILKILFFDSEILIFDEPTAILSQYEIKNFLKMVKNFKAEGKTIIFISHKLDEVFEVADRGAVIRKGEFIEEFDIKSITPKKISSLMVGREIKELVNKHDSKFGEVVLDVKDLTIDDKSISFQVKRGEVFAIAGISGNGQSELAMLVTGILKPKNGTVHILNSNQKLQGNLVDTTKYSLAKKYDVGLGFVPEDRQKYGLILEESIAFNSVLNRLTESDNKNQFYKGFPFLSVFKFMNWKAINHNALNIVKNFDVQGYSSITDEAGVLSGGNQQKVIVGREMVKDANLIVLYQPTRGLDIGSIELIHQKIIDAKKAGKAILLFSYELSEIFALADTIGVMNRKEIVEIAPAKSLTIQKVGELMTISKKGVSNE
ncbi:MAG: ATP-binding cassette domain-containing protein, partial [Mycoplasmoidaceae bacterium]